MGIETLLAEREIYRQLVRFARGMDERDWDALAAISTDDISAEFGTDEVIGSDAVIGLIRSYLDNCGTTQHLLGNYSDTWVKRGGKWLLCNRVKNNRALVGTMDVFSP